MGRLTRYSGNYDAFVRKRQANLERQLKGIQAATGGNRPAGGDHRALPHVQPRKIHQGGGKAAKSGWRRLYAWKSPVSEDKVRFSFEARRRTGEDVLIAKDLSKSYDGRKLFEHFSLHLRAGDPRSADWPQRRGQDHAFAHLRGRGNGGWRHHEVWRERRYRLLRPAPGGPPSG